MHTSHAAKVQLLQLSPLLGNAQSALIGEIAELASEKKFQVGSLIYGKGDDASDFFALIEGEVVHPEVPLDDVGNLAVKKVAARGQIFGFGSTVPGARRVLSARCESDVRVLTIDGRAFRAACASNGSEGERLLQEFTRVYAAYEHAASGKAGWISIKNASKVYRNGTVAVADCSIEIRPGEFCAIVGPSGCGKSTLLNAIAGFDGLSEGSIHLDGEWINRAGSNPKPGPNRIVVFQNGGLFPWATIRENLIRGPLVQGRGDEKSVTQQAEEMLARVGLTDIMDLYPEGISSGMCRRVEIIRALMSDPKVLLLDEPFRGIDALTKIVTQNALLELYDMSQKTVLFITHDLEEAIYLADRVLVMTTRPGRVKQSMFVNLPRPRRLEMLASPELLRLKDEAVEAVHEEAVKAFAAGEREFA